VALELALTRQGVVTRESVLVTARKYYEFLTNNEETK
jgi:hypothetical protein